MSIVELLNKNDKNLKAPAKELLIAFSIVKIIWRIVDKWREKQL